MNWFDLYLFNGICKILIMNIYLSICSFIFLWNAKWIVFVLIEMYFLIICEEKDLLNKLRLIMKFVCWKELKMIEKENIFNHWSSWRIFNKSQKRKMSMKIKKRFINQSKILFKINLEWFVLKMIRMSSLFKQRRKEKKKIFWTNLLKIIEIVQWKDENQSIVQKRMLT